jgi:hypothetical protein
MTKTPNRTLSRRTVLRGAAGFTLALPLLPSLLDKEAEAAIGGGPKRFVAFGTDHGGIWQQSMYPANAPAEALFSYGGHQVRQGALSYSTAGSVASISPVLSGDAQVLTSALAQKINLIRGLDVTFYLAHHRGGHLGNFAENDGNGVDGPTIAHRPTIDQLMAYSSEFYPDLATILERSLVIGANGMSANWSSPLSQSGTVQNISPENDSLVLFNKIFVPQEDPTQMRPPIVDRVLEDYQRLRQSNQKLSPEDRRRLDDHLERLDELQRKLNVLISCGDIAPPTSSSTDEYSSTFGIDPEAQKRFWQLCNDVIVAAFACDTCRIVSARVDENFSTYAGDWHQDVAHQAGIDAGQQAIIADAHQRFFEDVFLDLIAKLDAAEDVEGCSVLDSSLVQWTQEAGVVTHDPIEMAVVTAGSAGGFFNTGQYLDYRNLDKPAAVAGGEGLVNSHIGLVYNQWLGNVLQSMGMSPSSYESGQYGGYGDVVLSSETWYAGYQQYGPQLASMSDMLPFLQA